MSSERWQRLEEVFDEVLDKPSSEREAYLRQSCGDDRALRKAVDALLEADRDGEAFLEQPPVTTPASIGNDEAPPLNGGRLGPYRLLREIGRGGMSTVYLAKRHDDAFQRRMAVKVIRQGMESEDSLRRLQIERQILASMDHPYVAKLYDGGATSKGLPYFVMEYVEGLPIDLYCDHQQLTVAGRIDLFRKVCSAVHYAHQNLVVHRDIKPSNILVTAEGTPKLLDFGLAKLLNPDLSSSQAEPTVAWLRLLTPHYASPEQVRGEAITTASDVYSLGVLLYKLLTGRLPYHFESRTTPREVERLLADGEPAKPSTVVTERAGAVDGEPVPDEVARSRRASPDQLARQLDGDLDNVILMAMQSASQRRYASVEQLSEDLERYTQGFPVVACPSTFGYRLGKFLRRNRITASVAAIGMLLVLSFAVAMALQSARVARERDQARQERDGKQQLLGLIGEVFQLADPGEAGGETFTVRQALDRSVESIERRLADQPAMAAALRDTIGEIYLNLGLYAEARIHLAEAFDLRRAVHGADSLEVAESLSHLGAVYRELGDYPQAEALSADAVSLARRLVGDSHQALIKPLNHQVTLWCYQGEYEVAREPSLEALTLARRYLDDTRAELAEAVTNRAVVLRKIGDLDGAEELYREGLAIQRRILGEEHPEVANILNNLAVVLKLRDQPLAAERLHRQTLELRRKLYGETHSVVAQSLTNLASVLRSQGKYSAAEDGYRQALAVLDETVGSNHHLAIRVAVTLGAMLTESGRAQASERFLRDRLAGWRRERPEPDGWLDWAENTLGEALLTLRRYDEAGALLERTFAALEERHGSEDPKTRTARQRLDSWYEATGKPISTR